MTSSLDGIIKGENVVRLSQMYQTEICQCGKLKQFGKLCKACGLTGHELPAEYADGTYDLPIAAAQELPAEDEMERARR